MQKRNSKHGYLRYKSQGYSYFLHKKKIRKRKLVYMNNYEIDVTRNYKVTVLFNYKMNIITPINEHRYTNTYTFM